MLDKLSKKILIYLNSFEMPSEIFYDFSDDLEKLAKETSSDSETVRASVRYLHENGYIRYAVTQSGNPLQFYLDHKGLHWKEFRRQEIIEYLEDKWIDFFALVISFTALVISVAALLKPPAAP